MKKWNAAEINEMLEEYLDWERNPSCLCNLQRNIASLASQLLELQEAEEKRAAAEQEIREILGEADDIICLCPPPGSPKIVRQAQERMTALVVSGWNGEVMGSC